MFREKRIVIGCDDKLALSAILKGIHEINVYPHNVISVARISDLISVTKSINPDLIILSFRNIQAALNDCITIIKKPEVPILCFTQKDEAKILSWNKSNSVFTYPFEFAANGELLSSITYSIFFNRNDSNEETGIASFTTNIGANIDQTKNKRQLSRYVLELDQKLELLSKVKNRITNLCPQVNDPVRVELISIINAIKVSINDSKLWDDFKVYYEQTNPEFLLLLAQKHPTLTPKDLKYCCYLKMNMTNDDIRNLLGINQESVRTHKHRLKKKMLVPKHQDLRSYLLSIYE